jgi:hypothetical protein
MLSLPPRRSGPPPQPGCDGPCCLRLHGCRLGLRGYHFRGHLCVRLRYGLETRPHPTDEAVERLQRVGFPSPCAPSYRALAFPLVGLPPTEHASLCWTHNRACHFRGTRLLSDAPFVIGIRPTSGQTCGLTFRASPSWDIAPSCRSMGLALFQRYSSRSRAHHRPHVSISEALPSALAS